MDPTKQRIQQITKTLARLQTFRRHFDSKWAQFYRQYLGVKDVKLYPDQITPRSNVSGQYPKSNVEAIVGRVHDAYFSYEDWFETKPRGQADQAAARAMDMVLKYKLRRSKLPAVLEELVRNICIYGFGAVKVDWDWEFDLVVKPQAIPLMDPNGQPVLDPSTGGPIVMGVQPMTVPVPRSRPKFTVIDVFDLLVDPDGHTVAHLTEKTLGQILRESQTNPQLYLPEALKELVTRVQAVTPQGESPEDVLIRLAEVWDRPTGNCTLITFTKGTKENLSWKDQRYGARTGANLSTYKRTVFDGESILLWEGPNQFLHKQIPILYTSYVKLPNEVYGLGAVEMIADLSEAFDKFVNMITDNWNLNINKRYGYDINAEIDHESLNNFNVPGGKVGVVGNPSEVIFPLPHFTPSDGDYQVLPLYKNLIETTSGISDFYAKGVGDSGGNDTATGISSVITESNFRFKQFIRNLELDILQPLLSMCASMCQQFMTDAEEIEITDEAVGLKKLIWVSPEQLLGAVDFDLVAANYASNKILRQRNLLTLAGLISQSQYVREGEAIRELMKTFEVKNLDKLIKTDEEVAAEQQAAMQQQIQMMIFEAMLNAESAARQAQSKPQKSTGPDGRPRTKNPEGPIKGAGLTSAIRSMGQAIAGGRDLGLGDMGEVIPKG